MYDNQWVEVLFEVITNACASWSISDWELSDFEYGVYDGYQLED